MLFARFSFFKLGVRLILPHLGNKLLVTQWDWHWRSTVVIHFQRNFVNWISFVLQLRVNMFFFFFIFGNVRNKSKMRTYISLLTGGPTLCQKNILIHTFPHFLVVERYFWTFSSCYLEHTCVTRRLPCLQCLSLPAGGQGVIMFVMTVWDEFIWKNNSDSHTVWIQHVDFFFFQHLVCTEHVQLSAGGKKKMLFGNITDISCCSLVSFLLQFDCGGGATRFSIVFAAAAVSSTTFFTQRKIANETHASNSLICQPMRRLPIQSVNYGAINYCLQNINETCSLCAKTSRPCRDCVSS